MIKRMQSDHSDKNLKYCMYKKNILLLYIKF